MKLLKLGVALVVVIAAFTGGYIVRATKSPAASKPARKILYYVDPMHPAYKSDKPGIAPDCGMKLEPVYADDPGSIGTGGNRTIVKYRDPKDPTYTSDKPGLNPETGNTLEPVYGDEAVPPGVIRIPPERQQLIGVRFATVQLESAARTLRTVGKVTYDETRVTHVHPRIEGWIEKVFVDFTGDFVKKGSPLLTIYSPELLASQQELLLAARARDLMASNPLASAAAHGESLFEATKRRLELWDLSRDQIERVLETRQPIRSVTLHAPASGFVLERQAFPNQKVTPESDLYTIADLSRVWIMADVFESDIASLAVGSVAYVMFPYPGTAPLTARITYIQPQVDPVTRTIKVRLEAPNPAVRLKPEMFVNVEFGVPGPQRLTVPAEAVLDTGDRQTVFVDLGNGYLQARPVQIAERLRDRIVIASGLAEGERVVSSGTFLVDSESQLKAAIATMGAPSPDHSGHGAAPATPEAPKPDAAKTPGAHRHD